MNIIHRYLYYTKNIIKLIIIIKNCSLIILIILSNYYFYSTASWFSNWGCFDNFVMYNSIISFQKIIIFFQYFLSALFYIWNDSIENRAFDFFTNRFKYYVCCSVPYKTFETISFLLFSSFTHIEIIIFK